MNPLDELALVPERLIGTKEGRRAVTFDNPALFALIYLNRHLKSAGGEISFSTFHTDMYTMAKEWIKPLGRAKQYRKCVIAPRQVGKSTTMFLILPMWAAAHGHNKFIAAFSDSASQAENHLATFKMELQTNELLRNDFPELVEPRRGTNRSTIIADNRGQYIAESGFVFMARGIDSGNLGLKVGALRPDLLILDDVEPDGAKYSEYQAKQRLETIRDAIFYLNEFARVVIVGTTTMENSIIDQLRKHTDECDNKSCWMCEEKIDSLYYPAIYKNEAGDEVSLWPDKWSMEYLNEMRHTKPFRKNMMNMPTSESEGYWNESHIVINAGDPIKTILFIDPATTSNKKSDETGMAVISLDDINGSHFVTVRQALGIRKTPGEIFSTAMDFIEEFNIDEIVIESNQGGNLWRDVMRESLVPVRLTHSTKKKDYRISRAFSLYEKGKVVHARHIPQLEDQQLAYPALKNDDVIDAASTGILYILGEVGNRRKATRMRQFSYFDK